MSLKQVTLKMCSLDIDVSPLGIIPPFLLIQELIQRKTAHFSYNCLDELLETLKNSLCIMKSKIMIMKNILKPSIFSNDRHSNSGFETTYYYELNFSVR